MSTDDLTFDDLRDKYIRLLDAYTEEQVKCGETLKRNEELEIAIQTVDRLQD